MSRSPGRLPSIHEQVPHPDQGQGRRRHLPLLLDLVPPDQPGLAQAREGFELPKGLFDFLAFALTDRVAGVTQFPAVVQ